MSSENLNSLIQKASKTDGQVLLSLKEQAKAKAMEEPSPVNLVALDRATKMLEDFQKRQDLAEENQADGVPEINWKGYVETKKKSDVLRFLIASGWSVRRQTFYNHCNDGKLRVNRFGIYSRGMVKKYAEKWLVHSSTNQTVEETEQSLATQKTVEEIKRISTSQEHERFKLDVLKEKYILRSDVEVEFAARAVVLDSGLEYLFQANLAEMIAMVGGDQHRAPQLLDFLLEKKNQQMNEYANMGDFMVVMELDQQE